MAGGGDASSKGHLYAHSVDLARRLGLFDQQTVADAKGKVSTTGPLAAGAGMDWKELLRKFSKHNPQREGELLSRHEQERRGKSSRKQVCVGGGRRERFVPPVTLINVARAR